MQIKNYTRIVVINWQGSIRHSTVINCKTKLWEMSVRSLPCPCMPSGTITQAQPSGIRKPRLSGYSMSWTHALRACHATAALGRGDTKTIRESAEPAGRTFNKQWNATGAWTSTKIWHNNTYPDRAGSILYRQGWHLVYLLFTTY